MGKWIPYGEYQIRWRPEWVDKVQIIDYDRGRNLVKLALKQCDNVSEFGRGQCFLPLGHKGIHRYYPNVRNLVIGRTVGDED